MNIELALEQKLLLALLADSPEASPFYDIVCEPELPIDWAVFERLVKRHRVGAIVNENLPRLPQCYPPAPLADWLAAQELNNAHHFVRALAAAAKTTKILRKAGIDCVVLKGCSVAADYYQRPSLRAMIDVDLLVDSRHYVLAEAALISDGFERIYPDFTLTDTQRAVFLNLHHAFTFFRRSDGLQIDLHWRKVQNPVLLADMDTIWRDHIEWRDIGGADLPVLRTPLHFVYILVHGAKSGWVRLKWLVDLDKVVRGLSETEYAEAAQIIQANGLENLTVASLELCRSALGTPIPDALSSFETTAAVQHITRMQTAMAFTEEPARPHSVKDWRHYRDRMRHSVLLHRGAAYRRHALARQLARPDDVATVPLPPSWWWLLAVISPILGAGRALKRMLATPD